MRLTILKIDEVRPREPVPEVVNQPIYVDPLCRKCKYAHVERGYNAGEERLLCGLNGALILLEFAVRDCTDYIERRVPHVRVRVGFTSGTNL
jgi:hypothetical protein